LTLRFVPVRDNPGIVEVHDDEKLVAAVYAHDEDVAIISKYYTETLVDSKYPPKITVRFSKTPRSPEVSQPQPHDP
jgi:hypothetical protein